MKYLLSFIILLFVTVVDAQTFEQQVVDLVNQERVRANIHEFEIYGSIIQVREPLIIDSRLTQSAQWWCDALKGSGWFDHFGYVNAKGYLIDPNTGKQLSRVWLPRMSLVNNMTFFWVRDVYLGFDIQAYDCSENGILLKNSNISPDIVVQSFINSGYSYNPLFARKHYNNIVNPNWNKTGVGIQGWGGGKVTIFQEFVK